MKLYIGENIKRLRTERGLTQETLAEKLGVSFQSVSRWETDQSYPDIETVPEIAAFFEVTVDELMGTEKAELDERFIDELRNVIDLESEKDKLEEYRRMSRIYPKNKIVLASFLYSLSQFPEHIDEQRRLTEEYLCLSDVDRTAKDLAITSLIASEDEDKLTSLLDEYSTLYDRMSRSDLLAERSLRRGDTESSRKYSQHAFLYKLYSVDAALIKHGYPEGRTCDRPLEFINMLTGTNGMSLVAGDFVPDLWFFKRLMYGFNLSSDCVKRGKFEEAFLHLEDTVTLFERFYSIPDGTTLTFRCPELSELKITLTESSCSSAFIKGDALPEDFKHYKCLRATVPDFGLDMKKNDTDLAVEREMDQYHLYCPEYDIYPLVAREGWEGFDPIRKDTRFIGLVERMRKFIIEV